MTITGGKLTVTGVGPITGGVGGIGGVALVVCGGRTLGGAPVTVGGMVGGNGPYPFSCLLIRGLAPIWIMSFHSESHRI